MSTSFECRGFSRERKQKKHYNFRMGARSHSEIVMLFRNFESLTALKVPGGERTAGEPIQRLRRFTKATASRRRRRSPSAEGETPHPSSKLPTFPSRGRLYRSFDSAQDDARGGALQRVTPSRTHGAKLPSTPQSDTIFISPSLLVPTIFIVLTLSVPFALVLTSPRLLWTLTTTSQVSGTWIFSSPRLLST